MAFATKQRFGGRRATVGARVLLACPRHDSKPGICLVAGLVIAVSASQDRPYILNHRNGQTDWEAPAWEFFNVVINEASGLVLLEKMPVGSWTWLPSDDIGARSPHAMPWEQR